MKRPRLLSKPQPNLNILALILFLLVTCKKDKNIHNENSNIIYGAWVNPEYSDSTITFHYRHDLKKNEYGIKFEDNGNFTERKNSGWCGTPPISYTDYQGNWIQKSTTLNISVGFWGGTTEYEWEILLLNEDNLKVKLITENYIEE